MVLVAAMHITAAVWINDDEPGIQADALEWLDKLAPPSWKEPANEVARELLPDPGDYRHHRGGEDNGDAHLKNLLVHHQVIVPVTDGPARPRPVAADLLLRVRRAALEAARDQGDGGVAVERVAGVRRRGARGPGRARHRRRHEPRQGGGGGARAVRGIGRDRRSARGGARGGGHGDRSSGARGSQGTSGPAREPSGIVRAVLERHGRVDFLLNNAGGQYFVPAESIATKGWRAVQRLNVGGTIAMCQAAYELAMGRPAAGRSSTSRSRPTMACRRWRTRAPRGLPSRR